MTSDRIVFYTALGIGRDLEHWLEREKGKHVKLRFKRVDLIRLLTLRTWSLRYYLQVMDILEILLPILRSSPGQKRAYGLGLTVAALTGDGAERILLRELRRRYPNGEHIGAWRENEIERELAAEESEDGLAPRQLQKLGVLSSVSIDQYVRKYKRRTRIARRKRRAAEDKKRKPFRWSPWN